MERTEIFEFCFAFETFSWRYVTHIEGQGLGEDIDTV